MTAIEFLRIALAAYYVAKMVTQSAGPYAAFQEFRFDMGVRFDKHGEQVDPVPGTLAEWSQCIWCFSLSVAVVGCYVFCPVAPATAAWILTPLSIAGAVVWLDR